VCRTRSQTTRPEPAHPTVPGVIMPNYRRVIAEGGSYFLTVVTHERRPIFADQSSRDMLRRAIENEQLRRPFKIKAIVLLHDHLHFICKLPQGDADYAERISQIKKRFTRDYLTAGGIGGDDNGKPATPSRPWRVGETLLGTHDPQQSGLHYAHGVHPHEPREA